jgi:diacylglycerol kinase family enzyme
MKVVAIINHAAGRETSAEQDHRLTAGIVAAFSRVQVECSVHAVPPEEITETARRAIDAGVDGVVAAGGDGTVSAVAGALVGTNIPLGILPLGTLNHFAKDLRIPLALPAAAAVIANHAPRPIDVGEVNGHTFINNSSIGAYPRTVRHRSHLRYTFGQGKWSAMIRATLAVFLRVPLVAVRLPSESGGAYRLTPFVFIGNNQYAMHLFSMGGRASLDRGELSLYCTSRTGRLALIRLSIRALAGRLDQAKDFDALLLREFWIDTPRPSIHVAVDGEVLRLRPPLHYRVLPRALRVFQPPRKPD